MFHVRGHEMSMEGFRRKVIYILEQIILAVPLRTDYSEKRVEAGSSYPGNKRQHQYLGQRQRSWSNSGHVVEVELGALTGGLDMLVREGEACGKQLIHV